MSSFIAAKVADTGPGRTRLSFADLAQRAVEIGQKRAIRARYRIGSGDQHVICPGLALAPQYRRRGRAQPPLCPGPRDRIADPAAGGKADPHAAVPHRRVNGPGPGLQHQAGPAGADAGGGNP